MSTMFSSECGAQHHAALCSGLTGDPSNVHFVRVNNDACAFGISRITKYDHQVFTFEGLHGDIKIAIGQTDGKFDCWTFLDNGMAIQL